MTMVRKARPRLRTLACFATLVFVSASCDGPKQSPETQTPDDELLDEQLPEQDAVAKAGGLVESGKPQAGLDAADEALTGDPDNAELHFVRGLALQDLGRGEDAIAAWTRAIELDPKMFAAHAGIGTIHLDAGRLEPAKTAFEAALAVESDFAAAHFNLGIIALRRDDLEGAAAAFRRAADLDPDDADALLELASIQDKQGKRDAAKATVAEAVKADPENGYAQMVSGDIAAAEGAPMAQVVDAYQRAVEAEPALMPARLKLVRALRRAERSKDALAHSEYLVAQVPDQAIPWSDHAGVLTDLERYDDALAALDKALALDAKLVSAHRRKVLALAGANKCAEAKKAAAAFAETGADKAQVKEAKADAKACK